MTGIPSFSAERSALVSALEKIEKTIERRNTIPILANILIRADQDSVTLTATDLDIMVKAPLNAAVETFGAVTLPGELVSAMVRKMPEGSMIKIQPTKGAEGLSMMLSAGRAKATVNSLPASDFPDIHAQNFHHEFTLKASALREMMAATAFAISTEETRYYLNGIYLHVSKESLIAVATDGHRLSRFQMPIPAGAEEMQSIIVPRKTIHLLQGLIKTGDADIVIRSSDTKIEVEGPGFVLTSKLIDGAFPEYVRVIPKGHNLRGTFDRKPVSDAIDRVTTISGDRGRAVKFSFTENSVMLTVVNSDRGSAEEPVDISYDGSDLSIGFNAQYVKEALMALAADKLQIEMNDPGSPAILTDVADNSGQHLIVLMPMRI